MIQAGRAKVALLIQSSGTTRLMSPEDPMSAWFGDGATAVIVGAVEPGFGLLGQSHETHGEYYEGLCAGYRTDRGTPENVREPTSSARSSRVACCSRRSIAVTS